MAVSMAPAAKRMLDVVIASLVLLALSPLLLIVTAVLLAQRDGPVFFKQLRVGKHRSIFQVLKFRTMSASHRHDAFEVIAGGHPAVTPFGRWLRRTKIDEIPQLWNVVRGEMSLVGPRPTVPEQVENYAPWQLRRLEVRPGCTGLAQVYGNTALSWDDRIRYDVHYVDHWNLRLDMRIMWRTLDVVLRGEERQVMSFEDFVARERGS